MLVGDDLHLYVPRPCQIPLHVTLAATKKAFSFSLSGFQSSIHLIGRMHHLHTASPATVGSLNRHRIAVLFAEAPNLVRVLDNLRGTGNPTNSDFLSSEASRNFVPHYFDRSWRRSDESHTTIGDRSRKVSILAIKAIPRVNCFSFALLNGVKNRRSIQIRVGSCFAP